MEPEQKKLREKLIFLILMTLTVIGVLAFYFLTTSEKEDTSVLVFYHWWTSSQEQEALHALVNIFSEQYPNVTVIPTSIKGGSRQTPDSFEAHAGYESKPYFEQDLLSPVDNIWASEGLEKVISPVVKSMCKFEGHYYSIPISIHRSNLVWYNKEILDENGINPANLTSWDSFFAACDKLRANNITYPVQIGKDWTESHLFEAIVASQGIDFYENWINGKITSPTNPKLLKSLEIFKKYMGYANMDYSSLEWNKATERVINGYSAFIVMTDWANEEFNLADMTYNEDYGSFAVPGTEEMYGLILDTFLLPKYIQHPTNAERWLKVVASKEGQDAFNPLQGSISPRLDTNVSEYDLYQRLAIFDFLSVDYMLPSVVHGSGAPDEFRAKLDEVIPQFAVDGDITQAATALTDYTTSISDKFTTEWQLK